jgi:hypothetical protein
MVIMPIRKIDSSFTQTLFPIPSEKRPLGVYKTDSLERCVFEPNKSYSFKEYLSKLWKTFLQFFCFRKHCESKASEVTQPSRTSSEAATSISVTNLSQTTAADIKPKRKKVVDKAPALAALPIVLPSISLQKNSRVIDIHFELTKWKEQLMNQINACQALENVKEVRILVKIPNEEDLVKKDVTIKKENGFLDFPFLSQKLDALLEELKKSFTKERHSLTLTCFVLVKDKEDNYSCAKGEYIAKFDNGEYHFDTHGYSQGKVTKEDVEQINAEEFFSE